MEGRDYGFAGVAAKEMISGLVVSFSSSRMIELFTVFVRGA
jgi:hypothetical protein